MLPERRPPQDARGRGGCRQPAVPDGPVTSLSLCSAPSFYPVPPTFAVAVAEPTLWLLCTSRPHFIPAPPRRTRLPKPHAPSFMGSGLPRCSEAQCPADLGPRRPGRPGRSRSRPRGPGSGRSRAAGQGQPASPSKPRPCPARSRPPARGPPAGKRRANRCKVPYNRTRDRTTAGNRPPPPPPTLRPQKASVAAARLLALRACPASLRVSRGRRAAEAARARPAGRHHPGVHRGGGRAGGHVAIVCCFRPAEEPGRSGRVRRPSRPVPGPGPPPPAPPRAAARPRAPAGRRPTAWLGGATLKAGPASTMAAALGAGGGAGAGGT